MLRTRWVCTLLAGAVTGVWIFASTSHAATWDGGGGDGNWTTAANWAGDTAPIAGDLLQFGGTTNLLTNNGFAVGTNFASIGFLGGAGSFTLGGNGILLGGDINNNSGVAQTINFAAVPFTFNGLTYQQGGLVLDGATSNVNVSGGGSLGLGQVTLGAAPQSPNVSTLNINNSASASGLTVQTNSAGTNAVNIATGQTFTVNGGVFLGTPSTTDIDPDVQIPTNVTFAGGGNLATGGGNFFVGLGSQNFDANDRNVARVDMTALNNFTYSTGTTGTGLFGVGWMTRPDGQLRLSATSNTIVADVIGVGNSGITGTNNSPNNSGTTARLFLGAGTNVINADNINIGAVKGQGSIEWDAAVTTGTLTVAGQDGVGRANITIANQSSATAAGGASFLSLAGHSVNILAGTVQVGRLGGATGGTIAGNVAFDTGTFDINSLQIAVNASGTAANGVLGTFTMGGGSLTVNNAFILGNDTSAAVTGKTDATFTLNGGTVTANAPITRVVTSGVGTDVAALNINGGTFDVTGKDIASLATPLTTVNLNGGTLANAARINAAAITIGAPTFSGTPVFVLPSAGTLSSSGLTLASGQGIEGGGATAATVTGDVTLNSAGRIAPGSSGVAGTLTFNNNLTANNGAVLEFDLSDNPFGSNDLINVSGNLTVTGAVNVNIGTLGIGAQVGNTYTLINYSGTLTGNETNFNTAAGGTRMTFTVQPTSTTPGSVQVLVGGTGPVALTWIGNVNNNWNLIGAANWRDPSLAAQQFYNLDTVTFDDTSTNLNDVQIVGSMQPGSVTVNATRNYKFAGTGSLVGSGTLTKQNSGTLIVANNNSFTGAVDIQSGTVQVGDGSTSGSLGTGAITDNGTLIFNRSDTVTISAPITGAGNVQNTGSGVTVLSSTGNTFSGGLQVNSGTVRSMTLTSAGAGTITVAPGATFAGNGAATAANSTTVMNGGTLAAVGGDYSPQGDMTVNGPITVSSADNATPTTSRNVQLDGILHGSGNISVVQATGITNADGNQGFRLRNSIGTGFSDYTGTISVAQTAKFELRKVQTGAGSPAGTGKIVLTGGTIDGGTALTGTYSEFNLRNNTGAGGNTVFGNDVEIAGTGTVIINLLSDAGGGGAAVANGSVSTMGNLKIGSGQEIGTYKAGATGAFLAVEFPTVTLTGNGAKFSPKRPGFGAANVDAGDIVLGAISQQAAGYGITVAGTAPRQVSITGATNYTGDTKVDSGILSLSPISGTSDLANSADVFVASGALMNLNFSGIDTIDSLFLGGTPAAVGDWGSSLSGATNVSSLLGGIGILHVSTLGTVGAIGDYNNNGVVDAGDYVVWLKAKGAGATSLTNRDPANSGTVGAGDYNSWRSRFGNTSGAGGGTGLTSAVPEPGTVILALVMLVGAMFLRSRGVC